MFRERDLNLKIEAYQGLISKLDFNQELNFEGYGTWRDISEIISKVLDRRYYESSDWLLRRLRSSGRVLDVGSGLNGLAISCFYHGLNESVLSVNPAVDLGFPSSVRSYISRIGPEGDDGRRLRKATEASLNQTYPYFAQYMPFPNRSFDMIFDCYGAAQYISLADFNLYSNEVARLLSTGGVWVIVDTVISYNKKWLIENSFKRININTKARDLLIYSL